MAERYVVTVSKPLHQKVGEEAVRYQMNRKEYVQNALAFFVNRKINPARYEPGKEFDTVQVLKYSTEKIIRLVVGIEQNIPKNDGNKIYDNKGSVSQLVAYLQHEAKEKGEEAAIFFDQKNDSISGNEVIETIDSHGKKY